MGMYPVAYYDLSVAGVPVHSTAFRPIDGTALAANPFRVFTSLLRLELIEDPALREQAAQILARRRIFTDAALALVEQAERDGCLPSIVIPVHFGGLACDLVPMRALANSALAGTAPATRVVAAGDEAVAQGNGAAAIVPYRQALGLNPNESALWLKIGLLQAERAEATAGQPSATLQVVSENMRTRPLADGGMIEIRTTPMLPGFGHCIATGRLGPWS